MHTSKTILHDPINRSSTNCWLKNSFAEEDLAQVYNKNYINRHVVLFLKLNNKKYKGFRL